MRTNRIAGFFKVVWITACLAGVRFDLPAVIVCDGDPVPASVIAIPSTLPVLSTNTAQLVFKLGSPVGNDTNLQLLYTGTARNGYDVELLPALVLIPTLQTSATLIVKAKTNYPFSTRTLTVTITNSDNACVVPGSSSAATITLIGFDPPRLNAPQITQTNVFLSWWAPVSGYFLESLSQFVSGKWVTQTNIAAGIAGTNRVTLTRSSNAFYRLVKP